MDKFTHGIIAVNPTKPDENDNLTVLHFTGFWNEPTEADVLSLWEELNENDGFGLQDQMHDIELIPAPEDIVEYFNSVVESDNTEFDETIEE